MTGFGSAAAENARYRMTVALRAVNHRYFDLALRLREEHRTSEGALRDLLAQEVTRGRLEVTVEVSPLAAAPVEVRIDHGALAAVSAAFDRLAGEGLVEGRLTPGDALRLSALVQVSPPAERWEETDEAELLDAARRALAELVTSREAEGARLEALLTERVAALEAVREELVGLAQSARPELAAALEARLQALLGDRTLDAERLAQEVAVLADKSDVSEELDRLGAHLAHFRDLMAGGGAVGKRLDFLTQEIFRELNTTGSKCRHAGMTRRVLDGKVLVEQLREQVQNVE